MSQLRDGASGVFYSFVREDAESYYQEYKFTRLHIPTTKESEAVVYCSSRPDFLALLSSWNQQGRDLWKYWETI